MFPNRLRGRAMSLATMMLWLPSAGFNGTFFRLRDAAGVPGTFLVYAACCFAAAWLTWTRIFEMRGDSSNMRVRTGARRAGLTSPARQAAEARH